MAAQCGLNNGPAMIQQQQQQGPFVSSSVYYGYIPTRPLQQQEQHQAAGLMDVDVGLEDKRYHQEQSTRSRKRGFSAVHHEVASLMPRFKRFREGEPRCLRAAAEERGLAQMYHEPPLLRLSPAADCDMACYQPCARTDLTGNLKFQSSVSPKTSSGTRCQELEDMLLLTHGCTSYHHYRQSQPMGSRSGSNDCEEAEF